MTTALRTAVRGLGSVVAFALFGLGALAISPLVVLLRRPDRSHPIVRTAWRLFARLLAFTRLIRLEPGDVKAVAGAVIVANHPSLIDVILLVSLIPRTLYVAKHGLKGNPFLSLIVRTTALPDDATLPEKAASYLAAGWNVLVFPEGTRSPAGGGLQPLRRGAAQLALRAGAPVACVGIRVSQRILGKGQPPWRVGDRPVTYRFSMSLLPAQTHSGGTLHARAVALTEAIRARLAAATSAPCVSSVSTSGR